MTVATRDLTALGWCLGEIRESLSRAQGVLEARLKHPDGVSEPGTRSAANWLHQAQGALRFVELHGVATVLLQVEQMLESIDRGDRPLDSQTVALCTGTFAATLEYLEAVCAGSVESAVALFPQYRALLAAQGVERSEPADLYTPDLARLPVLRSDTLPEPLAPQEASAVKAGFERGLLGFLRDPTDGVSLQAMLHTATRMQRAQSEPLQHRYWWVAGAFLDALRTGALPPDLYAKRQVARIQQYLRRAVTDVAPVNDRMLIDMLLLLARAGQGSAQADAVRMVFQLEATVAQDFDAPRFGLLDPYSLQQLRSDTAQAKAAWERFVRGGLQDLPDFATAAQQLELSLSRLPIAGMRELGSAISALRRPLSAGDAQLLEAVSLEVASALLFIDMALEQGPRTLPVNDSRAQDLAHRLQTLMHAGGASAAVQQVSYTAMPDWLRDLTHEAQERLTTAAFVAELQANLKVCEARLDAFFRDPQQREPLDVVGVALQQVSGALRLLGHHEAASGADDISREVAGLIASADAPPAQTCELVAHNLGALGFFVDALRRGDGRDEAFAFSQGPDGFTAQLLQPGAQAPARPLPRHEQATPILESASRSEPLQTQAPAVHAADAPDTELLGIFLDEAEDVLLAIEAQRVIVELSPGDREALTTIRRGFHTLKGSSRMVGLLDFAEVAWALEQTLNTWLAQGHATPAQGLTLIAQAQHGLQAWVARLRDDPGAVQEMSLVQALAAQCRDEHAPDDSADLIDLRDAGLSTPVLSTAVEAGDPIDLSGIETVDLPLPEVLPPTSDPSDAVATTSSDPAEDLVRVGERELPVALYRLFLDEADQLLEQLGALQHSWQSVASAVPQAQWLDAVRAAHTLGGSARLVGLSDVSSAALSLEIFLQHVAHSAPGDDVREPAGATGVRFGEVLDRLRAALHQFAAGIEPAHDALLIAQAESLAQSARSVSLVDDIDPDLLNLFVAEADELLPQMGDALQRWRDQPNDREPSAALMRWLHTVKGSARMAGAMRLGQSLHDMETRIEALPVDAATPVVAALIDELVAHHDRALALYESMRDAQSGATQPEPAQTVTAVPGPSEPAVEPDPPATPPVGDRPAASRALVRVRADLLDRLVNEAGEVSIARARLDNELTGIRQSMGELAENVARLRMQLREIELAADSQIQARHARSPESEAQFDPLEFDRYTRFQELTRMLAESVNDVATVHQNALRGLDDAGRDLALQMQLTRELQQDLMRIRMVRFGSVADRLHRVVRQASGELGRQARLVLEGGETEIDRGVLERMMGPLEHMLRNALAHGIESPEDRLAAGKSAMGAVTLNVRQDGHGVIMTVTDDGRGLDLSRIRTGAIERDLMAPDAVLADRELAQLIFLPGFTTATQVSTLAGRGVGLDVVRAEVAAMGGRIELDGALGQGTRFTVHLPVSLAVTQVVVLTVGTTRIAVAANLVEQIMALRPDALAQAYARHAMLLRDEAVPLYFLGSLLELSDTAPLAQRQSPVVVLRSGSQSIALHVDHVAPSQEVVVKQVGPQLARLTGMAGATVLGNGDIVLILDPVQIAATSRVKPAGLGDTASFAPTRIDVAPTVMVVDDSVTVRKVTQRLLAREGYQVVLARDGIDALGQLQDTVPDAMLLDIEMPRMDGFELAAQLRTDPRWQHVPVIMISSRTADKHREQAQSLGVTAFLGKPYDESELLELLRSHTRRKPTAA
jgi:chemosensory pili system protein ChpA (sensor histidine kinase/response regulator)